MSTRLLGPDLAVVRGPVNVYVLRAPDGLVVVDTGFPGRTDAILRGLQAMGGGFRDVRAIVLTHCHPDHIGSAAELRRCTGAPVWAHPLDAPRITQGLTMRAEIMTPSPGLRNRVVSRVLSTRLTEVEPTPVDGLLEDGESLDVLPDLVAVHVPGHSAGQIALHWRRGRGVLLTADAFLNRRGLRPTLAMEDHAVSRESLARLATLDVDTLAVMHGEPVVSGGAAALRAAFGSAG